MVNRNSRIFVGRFVPQRNKWAYQRTKLNRAGGIARLMEKAYYAMWPGTVWPGGHCLNTCLVLAPIIRMNLEWKVSIVIGRTANGQPHAWIESAEQDILDPTFGQFDHGPALRLLEARRNWVLGHWPEFYLTQEQEDRLRAGFRPISPGNGWTDESGAIALMRDHPILSPLMRH